MVTLKRTDDEAIGPHSPPQIVDLWFSRARHAPLALKLQVPHRKKEQHVEFLRLLDELSPRLHALVLSGDHTFLQFAAARWVRAAPLLEELEVQITESRLHHTQLQMEFARPSKRRPPRSVPALRHITFSTLYPPWWHTVLAWPPGVRQALRSLRLERHTHVHAPHTLHLLRALPNLVSLHISGIGEFWEDSLAAVRQGTETRVPLLALRELGVSPPKEMLYWGDGPEIAASNVYWEWLALLDVPVLQRVVVPGDGWQRWLPQYRPVKVSWKGSENRAGRRKIWWVWRHLAGS
ncbi:hypothetical protein CALCODRAFT_518947 [Calocera cornea HHB12733]|uniref:Uncharacterized protein n=1 Tax=Calocera cornea HHB12733 TaxID=1353952 RepID=A0A165EKV9_9BASI|nr:hypothetical protein CALCODRAFT_518947 [Calocera cornea HHB12733]